MVFDRSRGVLVRAAAAPRPATNERLMHMITPRARERWLMAEVAHLTPARVAQILRSGLMGESPAAEHGLYTLMCRTWPRLVKCQEELKGAVCRLDWQEMTREDAPLAIDREALKAVRWGMRGDVFTGALGWNGMLRTLLDGWFRGVSVLELEWGMGQTHDGLNLALPNRSWRVDPADYGWASDSGELLLFPWDEARRRSFPREKFLAAVRNVAGGHDAGGALLRPLAWWWLAANFSQEWLLNFAQVYGQPFRFANYDASRPETKTELAALMEQMGSSAWAVAPEGASVEFVESAKNGKDNPQAHLLDLADRACDLLVLGQTLTSDVGESGSRALGDVHASVRSDVVDSAGEWLAEVLNDQLVPALAVANGWSDAGAALPWWEAARKAVKDTRTLAETLEILVRSGLKVGAKWAYDIMDIPAPDEGDELVVAPAAPDTAYGTRDTGLGMNAKEARRLIADLPTEERALVLAKMAEMRTSNIERRTLNVEGEEGKSHGEA